MSTPTEVKAPSAITDTMAVFLATSPNGTSPSRFFAMFVLYELVRGLPRFLSPTGAVQVLARDIGTLTVPMLLGWASAEIHEVLARRRGRARTALRRNTLIAAWAFGLAMVVGLVAERRDAARTPAAEQQAKPVAVQPRMPGGSNEGLNAYPQIAAPAPGVDSTAAKPVIINVVTPWIEIARMPQYVRLAPPSARPSAISTGVSASRSRFRSRNAYRRIGNSCSTGKSRVRRNGGPHAHDIHVAVPAGAASGGTIARERRDNVAMV